MSLEAIKYENGKLTILDQLKLPLFSEYLKINSVEDGFRAIKEMNVRGAPAIAIVGCLTVAVAVQKKKFENMKELAEFVKTSFERLVAARPTAVNMTENKKMRENLLSKLESEMASDVKTNKLIGDHGAAEIIKLLGDNVTILTHCNTGSLATAGYGTALGVIRSLQRENKLKHVFCTETRPYNQGARLTAYEISFIKSRELREEKDSKQTACFEKKIFFGRVFAEKRITATWTICLDGQFQRSLYILQGDNAVTAKKETTCSTVCVDCIQRKNRKFLHDEHFEQLRFSGGSFKCPAKVCLSTLSFETFIKRECCPAARSKRIREHFDNIRKDIETVKKYCSASVKWRKTFFCGKCQVGKIHFLILKQSLVKNNNIISSCDFYLLF
ncbi:unnamed protein product [Oikopleura dioica]|uniref:S-methyl-5-thioribose-1-phosphate isomerase n=1 Tax=Oikopleura dioica TaxID=34765 RepID=E4XLN0_OIKDI|nr:unnamed protein product [Oikopleura dioica]